MSREMTDTDYILKMNKEISFEGLCLKYRESNQTIALQQRVIELMVQQILLNVDNIEHGRNVEDTINYYTQKAKEQI